MPHEAPDRSHEEVRLGYARSYGKFLDARFSNLELLDLSIENLELYKPEGEGANFFEQILNGLRQLHENLDLVFRNVEALFKAHCDGPVDRNPEYVAREQEPKLHSN